MLKNHHIIKKYPRYFYIALTTLIVSFCFFEFSNNDCPIEWSAERPLVRSDFKGMRIHKGTVASTTYNITKEINESNGRLNASVKAFFYCYNSWMIKDTTGHDVILHEQKHFDIAELYARKFRKALRTTNFKDLKDARSRSDSLFKSINEEMDVFQDAYDEETDHSRNGTAQRKWNLRIAIRLNELKEYSASDFVLNQNSLSRK